jgi:predicted phage terminase large subunit-like protein
MSREVEIRKALDEHVSRARRSLGSTGALSFAHIYLGAVFHQKVSLMQDELFWSCDIATRRRNQRIAVAAPRGHAKSSVVSLAYVLWSALYNKEPFILLVSATRTQAVDQLRNIKRELQSNELLIRDFPDLCYPPGAKSHPKPWRDEHITLRNGVTIKAFGANQSIRGIRQGPHRPSLIVVDDLEDQEHVASTEQRRKLRSWFERTLLKTGDGRTNVIVVGTILHYDALLAHLTEPRDEDRTPGWEGKRHKAVLRFADREDLWQEWEAIRTGRQPYGKGSLEERAARFLDENRKAMLKGTKVLWPERESYERLMEMRLIEGRASFQAEKQNEPLDPDECLFREEDFIYWDEDFRGPDDLIRHLGPRTRFFGACDPSLGRGQGSDYTAIVILAEDRQSKLLYVVAADIARRSPEKTIERILEYNRMYPFRAFGVEANQFQSLMSADLKRRFREQGKWVKIVDLTNSQNKIGRVSQLEPLIAQGRLRLSKRHRELLDQLRLFPLAAHDDGPDALEMAIRTHQLGQHSVTVRGPDGTIWSQS